MSRQNIRDSLIETIKSNKRERPLLVGIDGRDASGKTTIANEITNKLGQNAILVSIDGFHFPKPIRHAKGPLSPIGYFEDTFDYPYLIEYFFKPIQNNEEIAEVAVSKFDIKTESANEVFKKITNDTLIIFEGVFLYIEELANFWDLKIYIDISPETSKQRGVLRDAEYLGGIKAAEEKYEKRYIPGQELYHQKHNPKSLADIVITNEDFENPKILLVD